MRPFHFTAAIATLVLGLVACAGSNDSPTRTDRAAPDRTAPSPTDKARALTVEGRIEQGVECPVLHTPDGAIYALADLAGHRRGDYVAVTGTLADTSICQQGEGTIAPTRIVAKDPPARDRDPARAGGIAVTSDYVQGEWVAKGVDADCADPDFSITRNRAGGSIIRTELNGTNATGYVAVGDTPAFHWDEGVATMPIETRGPDGLAVLPGQDGPAATLGNARIEGDGVVFVRCATRPAP